MAAASRSARTLRFFDDRSRYVDRFGWLLFLSTAAVVMLSLVDLSDVEGDSAGWSAFGVTALVAVTLSLAMRASGVSRLWQRIIDAILLLGVTAVGLLATTTSLGLTKLDVGVPIATTTLAVAAPVVVVRRLLRHRRVTKRTLIGAISAYLLIALAFYYAFLATDGYSDSSLFGASEPTTSFMYFSLTSITTLGYGDLVAQTEFGRLLATTEAVVGQVYLVTFVAMVVGLVAQNWRPAGRDEGFLAAGPAEFDASEDTRPGAGPGS